MPVEDTLRGRSPRDERDERAALGFVRQPAVRWLSPGLLAKSTHTPERAPDPLFSPCGDPPRVHAIDGPLRFDATGRRAQP